MIPIVNVLLSTLPGLGLPETLCLPVPETLTTSDLVSVVASFLPHRAISSLYLTTANSRKLWPSQITTLAQVACSSCSPAASPKLLPLYLNATLVGGKGGFGSQLRAAGGRMSSRKKKQNAELATGSARNLDGRRLRTIKEAKNLATYLATRPEMDRRQKEEKRKRWEQVIEMAEQREADMRAGKGTDGRRKGLSDEWIEEKEEVGENVKNAVKLAMSADMEQSKQENNDSSDHSTANSVQDDSDDEEEDPMELDESDMSRLTREAEAGDADALWVLKNKLKIPASMLPKQKPQHRFAGFDDDDATSDEEEESGAAEEDDPATREAEEQEQGKGKKAVHESAC